MKIVFFGSYDPHYSRNRVLKKGLSVAGVEIIECNIRGGGLGKFFTLAWKYWQLPDFDVMLVPFPGQEIMLLARILTRKPIVFDAFTSHYEGYILDRKKYAPDSFYARWYHWLDHISCRLADLVLLDTKAHIRYFCDEFNLPEEKFCRVFVGTDSHIFKASDQKPNNNFLVHFHGHFIPLQGVRYIVQAAGLLKNEPIYFRIIGSGQTYHHDRKLADSLQLKNIEFMDSVSYDMLPQYINEADVCLGIFGTTSKANLVIPNKVFEAIACAKPVITADTPAVRELLADGETAVFCEAGNPESLAEKIREALQNPQRYIEIGQRAGKLFQEQLREEVLGWEILGRIRSLL